MTEENAGNKIWLWRPPRGKDGYIGRRGLRPKEAAEKVTGRAVYTRDVYLPGMLYLKVTSVSFPATVCVSPIDQFPSSTLRFRPADLRPLLSFSTALNVIVSPGFPESALCCWSESTG